MSVRILYGAKFQLNCPVELLSRWSIHVELLNSVVGAIIFAKQKLLLARKYDRPSWRPDPVRFCTPSVDEVALRRTNGSLLRGHTRMEPTHWLASQVSPSVGPTQPCQPLNTTIPHHLLSSNCHVKIQSIDSVGYKGGHRNLKDEDRQHWCAAFQIPWIMVA